MPAKSLELKHAIRLIQELTAEIGEIEAVIKQIMDGEIQTGIYVYQPLNYPVNISFSSASNGTLLVMQFSRYNCI